MGCGAESFVSTKIPSTDILKCFEAKGLEVSSPPTPALPFGISYSITFLKMQLCKEHSRDILHG